MKFLEQSFTVKFSYKVVFTSGLFHPPNNDFNDFLINHRESDSHQKILFLVDEGVACEHPQLIGQIREYFKTYNSVSLVANILVLPGGEVAKNNKNHLNSLIEAIDSNGIDRQSYVAAIGGGSILDLAGYASAIAHRGRFHHADLDEKGAFSKDDTWINLKDEPDHQELSNREQEYFLKSIKEDNDLSDHMEDAVNSLRIAFACDESVRTGKVVFL